MNRRVGVTSRRLDCVAPEGLRRTFMQAIVLRKKEKDYFEGFLKQLDKFAKKRTQYYI